MKIYYLKKLFLIHAARVNSGKLFKEIVIKINENPVGYKLFEKIREVSKINDIEFLIIEDVTGNSSCNTSFQHGLNFEEDERIPSNFKEVTKGKLYLYVNLDNAINCCISSERGRKENLFAQSECLCGPKRQIGETQIFVYPISMIYSPFHVVITHEFIHFKHFLDTLLKRDDGISCGLASRIKEYYDIERIKEYPDIEKKLNSRLLPELSELNLLTTLSLASTYPNIVNKLRRMIPWDNFEERRTVCGPDVDGISEMTFRIAEELPIRYIYQGFHYFLEDAVIVEQIVNAGLEGYNKLLGTKLTFNDVNLPLKFNAFQTEEKEAKGYGIYVSSIASEA